MSHVSSASSCRGDCANSASLGFDFTFAFQPIVDVSTGCVSSQEALVRGPAGEGARSILDRVNDENRYIFDQACRTKALSLAVRLGLNGSLNVNFLPNAVYNPAQCIRSTLAAARKLAFPIDRIVFEVSEAEQLTSTAHLVAIFAEYKRLGFKTAIDDFGAGYSGLSLLADFQPDILKLDMKLVRDIDRDRARQAIVRGIISICRDIGTTIVAEGVESTAEAVWLRDAGIRQFQGYLFARPAFEAFARVSVPPELTAGATVDRRGLAERSVDEVAQHGSVVHA